MFLVDLHHTRIFQVQSTLKVFLTYCMYVWSHDETVTSSTMDKLAAGSYVITVRDAYGCASNFTFELQSERTLSFAFVLRLQQLT